MFKFLSVALAALLTPHSVAFTPADCFSSDCVIIAVVLCGDPHMIDVNQDMFDVGGECNDVVLMDNEAYDDFDNDYLMTADIMQIGPEMSIVSAANLTISGQTIYVTKDSELTIDADENSETDGEFGPLSQGMTVGGVQVAVKDKEIEAEGRRSLVASGSFLDIFIFVGGGVIIVISTAYGAICIKIVGPFSLISIIIGIFTDGLRRELSGAEQSNLRADENARRQLMPPLPSGCTVEPVDNRRNLKVSMENRELVAEACSGIRNAEDMSICASLEA